VLVKTRRDALHLFQHGAKPLKSKLHPCCSAKQPCCSAKRWVLQNVSPHRHTNPASPTSLWHAAHRGGGAFFAAPAGAAGRRRCGDFGNLASAVGAEETPAAGLSAAAVDDRSGGADPSGRGEAGAWLGAGTVLLLVAGGAHVAGVQAPVEAASGGALVRALLLLGRRHDRDGDHARGTRVLRKQLAPGG
jgi:hypothetical protein